MTVFAFGPKWKSALVRNAVWVDVPKGRTCIDCMGYIGHEDQGLFVGYHDQKVNVAHPIHLECFSIDVLRGSPPNVHLECEGDD